MPQAAAVNKKALEMLFQRPLEPSFTPRDNGKAVFDLPESYYSQKFADVQKFIHPRFSENVAEKIPVQALENVPDLSFTKPLEDGKHFSLFNINHQKIAGRLVDILMAAANVEEFIALCVYCKDHVENPFLFQYCYAVAIQHRQDTRDIPVKSVVEIFPKSFIAPAVFKQARAEGELIADPTKRRHINIPFNFTASEKDIEQRLAYFREDPFVNSHHWHWHAVYPGQGSIDIVKKDRRGELFFYMHHQMMARYNVERFCNDLPQAVSFDKFLDNIPEGYSPKILDSYNNRTFSSRTVNSKLNDIDRKERKVQIEEMDRWTERIFTAIDKGFVVHHNGQQVALDPKKGIDILGNIVESTELSVNSTLYGNLHNDGHIAIGYCHDPDGRFLEDVGVMGDLSTAMRDPMFYRWHVYIDIIFNRHKNLLDPYSRQDLEYKNISITKLAIEIEDAKAVQETLNTLITHWSTTDVDVVSGLDFGSNNPVYATFTHLQHVPFRYIINVTNDSDQPKKGTCRIFLCPRADESDTALQLSDQRRLAIEMDKFTVNLNAGPNTIKRESKDSSVTVPYQRVLGILDNKDPFCGCGWPDHMLLPKGKPEGIAFDLFVMISDYELDVVPPPTNDQDRCHKQAPSYCGLRDKLYPDNRSMGYPFDRRLEGDYLKKDFLKELVDSFGNMATTEIVIRFHEAVFGQRR